MDRADIIELYDRHARELLGYFARRTRDPQIALDLVGETFLAAFEQRRRCRARSDRQRAAWLYRIAANELIDHARASASEERALGRLGGELRTLTPGEIDVIEQLAGSSELDDAVSKAFDELSDEQRQAIRLRVVDERSYADVSRELGLTEPAVRARVSRGLRALRRATQDTEERR